MRALAVPVLLAAASLGAGADTYRLQMAPGGAAALAGRASLQRIALSPAPPPRVRKGAIPGARYAQLRLGPATAKTAFTVMLVEPAGKPARFYVDADADGNLTNDAPVVVRASQFTSQGEPLTQYSARAELRVPFGPNTRSLGVILYRFARGDASHAGFQNAIGVQPDFAASGEVRLGNASYKAMLIDDSCGGDFSTANPSIRLLIDVSQDGRFDNGFESFSCKEPFNIGGTTYEVRSISADGSMLEIGKSERIAEETVNPFAPRVGRKALPFDLETMDKKLVRMPGDYASQAVLVEVWSLDMPDAKAWCATTASVWRKYKGEGLAVLGVNVDGMGKAEAIRAFCKEHAMGWPHIYDGQGADAEAAQLLGAPKPPFRVLIDGTTSTIVAVGSELNDQSLEAAVARALKALRNPKPTAAP
ncbi:MAG: TlpA disulfide reductase family protein [Armatimonadetes bacterium]|nr:TlpA disulfide reductase family protein [Armatimonadota bacterium]